MARPNQGLRLRRSNAGTMSCDLRNVKEWTCWEKKKKVPQWNLDVLFSICNRLSRIHWQRADWWCGFTLRDAVDDWYVRFIDFFDPPPHPPSVASLPLFITQTSMLVHVSPVLPTAGHYSRSRLDQEIPVLSDPRPTARLQQTKFGRSRHHCMPHAPVRPAQTESVMDATFWSF